MKRPYRGPDGSARSPRRCESSRFTARVMFEPETIEVGRVFTQLPLIMKLRFNRGPRSTALRVTMFNDPAFDELSCTNSIKLADESADDSSLIVLSAVVTTDRLGNFLGKYPDLDAGDSPLDLDIMEPHESSAAQVAEAHPIIEGYWVMVSYDVETDFSLRSCGQVQQIFRNEGETYSDTYFPSLDD
jgi:hypothetical protein